MGSYSTQIYARASYEDRVEREQQRGRRVEKRKMDGLLQGYIHAGYSAGKVPRELVGASSAYKLRFPSTFLVTNGLSSYGVTA
jgi:hypothetical protein